MAATYTKVPLNIPSPQRSMLITNVVAGDKIDIEAILGRPAKSVIITADDATDSISYRLNSLRHLKVNEFSFEIERVPEIVDVWSSSPVYPVYVGSGSSQYSTISGLQITSIEVTAIVFGGGGSAITIVVA
jgi:hypothetical protein